MIVRGGKDAQAVGRGDSCAVNRCNITDCSGVLCDGRFLHIIGCLTTNEKAFVTKNGINIRRGPLEHIEECPASEVWLFEVEIKLAPKFLGARNEVLDQGWLSARLLPGIKQQNIES